MTKNTKEFFLNKKVSEWMLPRVDWNLVPEDLKPIADGFFHGKEGISFVDIQRLALALHIPVGNFVLQTPPLDYSSDILIEFEGEPSFALIDTIAHIEQCLDIASDILHLWMGQTVHEPYSDAKQAFEALIKDMPENRDEWTYDTLINAMAYNHVLVFQSCKVDTRDDFQLSPLEARGFCKWNTDISGICINGMAYGKMETLLTLYALVQTGHSDIIPSKTSKVLMNSAEELLNIEAPPASFGFKYPEHFREIIRGAYNNNLLKPTDAYRMLSIDSFGDFDELILK